MWRSMQSSKDPELAQLASKLTDTVVASRADSTTRKYQGAVERWRKWAAQRDMDSATAEPEKFALYLQYIGEKAKSKTAVEEAVNAVSWFQRISGQERQMAQHPLIISVVEGFQRTLAKPKVKKEPVTPQMLRTIVQSMGANPGLSDLRLAAICLLAFAGFLRFDELAKLRGCDIKFLQDRMELHISSSKTDQLRQGATLLIARTGNGTCPVSMLRKYTQAGSVDLSSEKRLFRGIVKTKKGERLRTSGGLSYTRMREIILGKLQDLGYDARRFGLHSFRAGGATAAANAPGISERNFKRHGRWKSEAAKDGYVLDSESSRLMVSQSLGI